MFRPTCSLAVPASVLRPHFDSCQSVFVGKLAPRPPALAGQRPTIHPRFGRATATVPSDHRGGRKRHDQSRPASLLRRGATRNVRKAKCRRSGRRPDTGVCGAAGIQARPHRPRGGVALDAPVSRDPAREASQRCRPVTLRLRASAGRLEAEQAVTADAAEVATDQSRSGRAGRRPQAVHRREEAAADAAEPRSRSGGGEPHRRSRPRLGLPAPQPYPALASLEWL